MLVMKLGSTFFCFLIGPPKSISISSFGSIHFGRGDDLLCGITGFKFLPNFWQALHSLALAIMSRWIYGLQMFCLRDNIAKLPGTVEWMSSNTASLIALGIAFLSSIHKQPCFTFKFRQNE